MNVQPPATVLKQEKEQPHMAPWQKESDYVVTRDGTRLAIDIYRPATPSDAALPVIWALDRYRRAYVEGGKVVTLLDRHPWIGKIIAHGYIVAVVDIRGGGASFGKRDGSFSNSEIDDTYDVTEWLAAKPWCNGKVGMFGRSYLGIVQYLAARAHPPHLVTVVPEKAMFDLYSFIYPGGVFREDYKNWVHQVRAKDQDSDGATLTTNKQEHELALAEHRATRYDDTIYDTMQFRDSPDPHSEEALNLTRSPSSHLEQIRRSSVAFYHIGGWFDMWPKDTVLWFKNLGGAQKMLLGPWAHKEDDDELLLVEHLRWYDFWLKGIDNGVMRDPPVRYFVMDAPEGLQWRSAATWPIPQASYVPMYLSDHGLRTGTVASVNDGALMFLAPTLPARPVTYRVDFSTTSGNSNRWTNGYKDPYKYPDMAVNDAKGLTYTSDPLVDDLEVIGHPYVDLFVAVDAPDLDVIVYLEEILPSGYSSYVTEGVLRCSHRKVHEAPYDNLGLPFHRSFAADMSTVGEAQMQLTFELHPTAKRFRKGHRIRVSIVCADQVNLQCVESPGATLTVLSGATHLSSLHLPVAPIERPSVP